MVRTKTLTSCNAMRVVPIRHPRDDTHSHRRRRAHRRHEGRRQGARPRRLPGPARQILRRRPACSAGGGDGRWNEEYMQRSYSVFRPAGLRESFEFNISMRLARRLCFRWPQNCTFWLSTTRFPMADLSQRLLNIDGHNHVFDMNKTWLPGGAAPGPCSSLCSTCQHAAKLLAVY